VATIGAALVVKASGWGVLGLLLFGIVHWSCDLAWYWLVTVALARGAGGVGRLPRAIYFCSGLLLIGFGLWFLYGSLAGGGNVKSCVSGPAGYQFPHSSFRK